MHPPANARHSPGFSNCQTPRSRGISCGAMSPKTRHRRRSAATSRERIEFVPSRRAALAWMVWLCVAAVLTFACALPWPLRFLTAALVVAAGVPAVLRCVLLRGQSAVRALEWNGQPEGGFVIFLGPARRPLPAMPEGCRKY